MILRNYNFKEFPFKGKFYRIETIQDDILVEGVSEETILYEGQVDIQIRGAKGSDQFIEDAFEVYFPCGEILSVKKGDSFIGEGMGQIYEGVVRSLAISIFGKATAYLKDKYVNE